jgi:hypothetical protein
MAQIVSAAPGWIATDGTGTRRLVVAWAIDTGGDAKPVFVSDDYDVELRVPAGLQVLVDPVQN